jgi:hypothetical protein
VLVVGPELDVWQPAWLAPATPTALPHTFTGAAPTILVVPVEITDPLPVDPLPVELPTTGPELEVLHAADPSPKRPMPFPHTLIGTSAVMLVSGSAPATPGANRKTAWDATTAPRQTLMKDRMGE